MRKMILRVSLDSEDGRPTRHLEFKFDGPDVETLRKPRSPIDIMDMHHYEEHQQRRERLVKMVASNVGYAIYETLEYEAG